MNRRLGFIVLAAAVVATFSTGAMAQWKWRDKGGQLHISDMPPPSDIADKDVLQRPNQVARAMPSAAQESPGASAASAPRGKAVDPELEARLKRAEQERLALQRRDEDRNAAIKAENCNRAKEQMRTLDSGIRLARVNEKGEREILDDKARASEMQRARESIAANCGQ